MPGCWPGPIGPVSAGRGPSQVGLGAVGLGLLGLGPLGLGAVGLGALGLVALGLEAMGLGPLRLVACGPRDWPRRPHAASYFDIVYILGAHTHIAQ